MNSADMIVKARQLAGRQDGEVGTDKRDDDLRMAAVFATLAVAQATLEAGGLV